MAEQSYTVTYGGLSPWGSGNVAFAPYVSLDVQEVWSDGQLGFIRTVTLNGTIPSGGVSQITGIKSAFTRNFQPFVAPNISMPAAMVQEMTFSPQNYFGKVDYAIVLKDYSGFIVKINNPVDEVSFVNDADGSVTINHRVSAVGIDPNASELTAFQNAKNFVIGRTGLGTINSLTTSFVSQSNISNIFCLSQQETIDRANASYGVSEVFKYDPLRNASGGVLRRFAIDINSGINEDYIQVAVNGTFRVGKDVWNTGIFAQYVSGDMLAMALGAVPTINTSPLSFSVESDEVTNAARVLTIKAVYDTLPSTSFFEYDIETQKDFRNGVTQASVRGQIIGQGRHVRRRFDSALNFFNNVIGGVPGTAMYLYNAAKSGTDSLGFTSYPFNPIPKSFAIGLNSGLGTITMNATFDDAPFVTGYAEFNWNIGTDCGLNIWRPRPSVNANGTYIIQDLGILNRTSVNINGNFAYQATGNLIETTHLGMLSVLKNLEGTTNIYVESEGYNISKGDAIRTGFAYNYTQDGSALTAIPADGRIFTAG